MRPTSSLRAGDGKDDVVDVRARTIAGLPLEWAGLVVLAGALVACRAEVVAELDAQDKTASWVVVLDDDAMSWLADAGIDPAAALSGVARTPWTFEQTSDGSTTELRVSRRVDDVDQLGGVMRELTDALTDDDPALVVDVDVRDPDARTLRVDGTAGVRLPTSGATTIDGEQVGPSAAQIAELARRHLDARLVVTVPGRIVEHDGEISGGSVEFDLPVGSTRQVSVEARAPRPETPAASQLGLLVTTAVVAVLVVGCVVLGRRRTARSHGPPAGGAVSRGE